MKDFLASRTKIIGLILAFLILVIMPPFYTSYWVTLVTQMLIYGVLAMSLDILIGYTGLSSFGHAGFSDPLPMWWPFLRLVTRWVS